MGRIPAVLTLCALTVVLAACRTTYTVVPSTPTLGPEMEGPEMEGPEIDGPGIEGNGAVPGSTPIGHWVYASGESEGSTTHVSGDLHLNGDYTFTDDRYIGGIGAFREGTFTIEGTSLILTYDGGASTQVYSMYLSQEVDSAGVVFDTLLLGGDGLSFLLTRAS